jgi:hypothetical protein
MLIYLMVIWNILWIFWIFYENSVHFVFILYIFSVLVSCTKKNLATMFGDLYYSTLNGQPPFERSTRGTVGLRVPGPPTAIAKPSCGPDPGEISGWLAAAPSAP